MKKIKICMFTFVFMLSVFALTACGGRNNSTNQATQSTTQDSGQGGSTSGSSSGMDQSGSSQNQGAGMGSGGSNMEESSTGVIDGMMNDVESGVDDLLDNPTDESNRSDESK